MTALLSPRDGDELIAHLRSLAGADHVQTHTIPQLASGSSEQEAPSGSGGLLGKFRKKKASATATLGCDPMSFADENHDIPRAGGRDEDARGAEDDEREHAGSGADVGFRPGRGPGAGRGSRGRGCGIRVGVAVRMAARG